MNLIIVRIMPDIAPCLTGFFMSNAVTGLSIVLAGLCKSVYDVSLYHAFQHVPFHDEQADRAPLMESAAAQLESRKPESVR